MTIKVELSEAQARALLTYLQDSPKGRCSNRRRVEPSASCDQ
jgi:hypothetical protein